MPESTGLSLLLEEQGTGMGSPGAVGGGSRVNTHSPVPGEEASRIGPSCRAAFAGS